jgi:hypothetical protein
LRAENSAGTEICTLIIVSALKVTIIFFLCAVGAKASWPLKPKDLTGSFDKGGI